MAYLELLKSTGVQVMAPSYSKCIKLLRKMHIIFVLEKINIFKNENYYMNFVIQFAHRASLSYLDPRLASNI
jgi:hypothetical protein